MAPAGARGKVMAPPPPPQRKNLMKGDTSGSSSNGSLIFRFDEMTRHQQVLLESAAEEQFLQFVLQTEIIAKRGEQREDELLRLKEDLDKALQEISTLERKLNQARVLLSEENHRARKAEREKEVIAKKFQLLRELLTADSGNTINNETRQKLQRLEASVSNLRRSKGPVIHYSPDGELSVVNEIDSTGSILDVSDFSFDETCDPTMDTSRTRSGRNYKRKSGESGKRRSKRSRGSSGRILDTETENEVVRNTRKSLEEIAALRSARMSMQEYNERNIDDYVPSAPPLENNGLQCWTEAHNHSPLVNQMADKYFPTTPSVRRSNSNTGINARRHTFDQKKIFYVETCGPCGIKIKFRGTAYKCRDCKVVTHAACRDKAPLPCIGIGSAKTTPGKSQNLCLADVTPLQAPMVPAIIVHCVNEIEKRGLTEVGLYRVPGSERDVKELKERFLRGKGCPILSKVNDIHVICGCIKDFLRSLKEPLVPQSMWTDFVQVSEKQDETDAESEIYQAISKLPQPNRDTMAFLILHFKRVAEVQENMMNVSNLAKILGPTIIGYKSGTPDPNTMISELHMMSACLEKLIWIDSDYWRRFLEVEGDTLFPRLNVLSPSTPDLFKPLTRDTGLTPKKRKSIYKSEQQIFSSPMLTD